MAMPAETEPPGELTAGPGEASRPEQEPHETGYTVCGKTLVARELPNALAASCGRAGMRTDENQRFVHAGTHCTW